MNEGFPGERREHQMRKLARSNAAVTCGSCRQFDGLAWCRRWNFHTSASSPICDQYRPVAEKKDNPSPLRGGSGGGIDQAEHPLKSLHGKPCPK